MKGKYNMKEQCILRLKELMKKNNDNTVTLARKINVTNQAVSYWLLNKREPKVESLENIADCYGVSVDYLLCRKD